MRTLAWAGIATLAVFLAYLAVGAVNLSLAKIISELLRGPSGGADWENTVLWQIRMPRAIACLCAGGILGIVGSAFQAMFRNALAEPYVIGVSSGAAVGGTLAILLGWDFGLVRVGLAMSGALASLVLVLAVARRQGAINIQSLLIGGVVVGALLSGFVTLNLWMAGQDMKILWWLLGSTSPMYWDRVSALVLALVLGFIVLHRQSRALNAFSVSEFMAERQGVEPVKLKWIVLVTSSAMTGVAVGCVGIIGFVGLLAPHIARRILGSDLRVTMPVSALLGSTLLMGADILAQRLKPGTELPLGAVTAVLGAPALLWMLRKKG